MLENLKESGWMLLKCDDYISLAVKEFVVLEGYSAAVEIFEDGAFVFIHPLKTRGTISSRLMGLAEYKELRFTEDFNSCNRIKISLIDYDPALRSGGELFSRITLENIRIAVGLFNEYRNTLLIPQDRNFFYDDRIRDILYLVRNGFMLKCLSESA